MQSQLARRPDKREERREELLAPEAKLKGKVSARCLSVSARAEEEGGQYDSVKCDLVSPPLD